MKKLIAWLIKNVFANFYFPWERTVLKEELDYFISMDCKAYVILTYTPYQLANLGITGKYKHAELVVGPHTACSARTDGYKRKNIKDVLKTAKKYAILRPRMVSNVDRKKIADWAIEKSDDGIRYDFELDLKSSDAWYCTESINIAFKANIDRNFSYGKMIYPDELLHDKTYWEVVGGAEF